MFSSVSTTPDDSTITTGPRSAQMVPLALVHLAADADENEFDRLPLPGGDLMANLHAVREALGLVFNNSVMKQTTTS